MVKVTPKKAKKSNKLGQQKEAEFHWMTASFKVLSQDRVRQRLLVRQAPGPQIQEQIVAKDALGTPVADVPVTVLHKFQQTKLFENLEVPLFQFIDRVLDMAGMPQRQVRTVPNCAEFCRLHRCSAWERLLTRPSLCNDRCR